MSTVIMDCMVGQYLLPKDKDSQQEPESNHPLRDGDSYGEGGNHILHGIRRNVDLTHVVHFNQIYGLTKGRHLLLLPRAM